jgi:hypothetical protein
MADYFRRLKHTRIHNDDVVSSDSQYYISHAKERNRRRLQSAQLLRTLAFCETGGEKGRCV